MEKKTKKIIIISIAVILIILILVIIGTFMWYYNGTKSVEKENGQIIRVEIKEGTGIVGIAQLLEEKQVIKSANSMKIYAKLNHVQNLKAGKYDLNNAEDLATILAHIQNGEIVNEEIKITFVEGKNMRSIAKTIAEKTNNTEEDV